MKIWMCVESIFEMVTLQIILLIRIYKMYINAAKLLKHFHICFFLFYIHACHMSFWRWVIGCNLMGVAGHVKFVGLGCVKWSIEYNRDFEKMYTTISTIFQIKLFSIWRISISNSMCAAKATYAAVQTRSEAKMMIQCGVQKFV